MLERIENNVARVNGFVAEDADREHICEGIHHRPALNLQLNALHAAGCDVIRSSPGQQARLLLS